MTMIRNICKGRPADTPVGHPIEEEETGEGGLKIGFGQMAFMGAPLLNLEQEEEL